MVPPIAGAPVGAVAEVTGALVDVAAATGADVGETGTDVAVTTGALVVDAAEGAGAGTDVGVELHAATSNASAATIILYTVNLRNTFEPPVTQVMNRGRAGHVTLFAIVNLTH